VHAANGALSRRHSNVAPGSSALNANCALALSVRPDGPESICVSGAVRSPWVIVTSWTTGVFVGSVVESVTRYCA